MKSSPSSGYNLSRMEVKDFLIDAECISLGIVSVRLTELLNVNRLFTSLHDDESRRVKRKFRKLWRKLAKQNRKDLKDLFIKQGDILTPFQSRERKRCVKISISNKVADKMSSTNDSKIVDRGKIIP